MKKIDPRSPGASSAGDEHCDPHGHGVGSPSEGGHVGMGRDDSGGFKSMSRGGVSEDGDAMVEKYRPGKGGGGSSDEIPAGSELNDDGDGYA
jgi:hypothetical protein